MAKQYVSRRRFLRRSLLAVWGVAAATSVSAALAMLYPSLAGQFGSALTIGRKVDFPGAQPQNFKLDIAGIFYHQTAKAYIVHLAKETTFLLQGTTLETQLATETVVKDNDGSCWIALFQRCVHLGCTVPFRDDCVSFKCPCHGSHYHVSGEFLDGPAPRSLDRFALSFHGETVVVDTGTLNNKVPHPDHTTRLLALPVLPCSV